MKLRTLEAFFVKWRKDADNHTFMPRVDNLEAAHGVCFLCPLCFQKNGGNVGTHAVICWFKGKVPDEATPGPGRWNVSGSGIDDLTLSPSVNLDLPEAHESIKKGYNSCLWHGWVKNGDAA